MPSDNVTAGEKLIELGALGNPASYELHPQAPTPQQRSGAAQPFAASGQQFPSSNSRASRAPGRGEGAFRMGNMAGALPDYPPSIHPYAQAQTPQRLPPGASSPALVYQLQQLSQFAGQTPGVASGYNISPFPSQFVQGQQGTVEVQAALQTHLTDCFI